MPRSIPCECQWEYERSTLTSSNASIEKLLSVNRRTGIESRASVLPDDHISNQPTPPSISDLDALFRKAGVDLAAQACEKALQEWGGKLNDITHTVAVTCTNAGNPGYDLLVAQRLGLRGSVERMLLQGVGCAGGLAMLRAAAQISNGASLRGKPARILAFACELCTPNVRCALDDVLRAESSKDINIAAALFGDGAAAAVVCNEYAKEAHERALFEYVTWGTATIPQTQEEMSFLPDTIGK